MSKKSKKIAGVVSPQRSPLGLSTYVHKAAQMIRIRPELKLHTKLRIEPLMKIDPNNDLLNTPENSVLFAGVSMNTQPLLMGEYLNVHANLINDSRAEKKIVYLGDGLLRYNMMFDFLMSFINTPNEQGLATNIANINNVNRYTSDAVENGQAWLQTNREKYHGDDVEVILHSTQMKRPEFEKRFLNCVALYCESNNREFRTLVNRTVLRYINSKLFMPGASRQQLPTWGVEMSGGALSHCVRVFFIDIEQGSQSPRKLRLKAECINNSIFKNLLKLCFGYVLEELAGFELAMNDLLTCNQFYFIYPGKLDVIDAYFSLLRTRGSKIKVNTFNIKNLIKRMDKLTAINAKNDAAEAPADKTIALKNKIKKLTRENKKYKQLLFQMQQISTSTQDGALSESEVNNVPMIIHHEALSDNQQEIGQGEVGRVPVAHNEEINGHSTSTVNSRSGDSKLVRAQLFYYQENPQDIPQTSASNYSLLKVCFSGLNMEGGCKLLGILRGSPWGDPQKPLIGVDFIILRLTADIKVQAWITTEQNRAKNIFFTTMQSCRNNIFHFDLSDHWAANYSNNICEERMIACRAAGLPCFMIGILSKNTIMLSAFKLFEEIREKFEVEDVLYCGIDPIQVNQLRLLTKVADEESEGMKAGIKTCAANSYSLSDSVPLLGSEIYDKQQKTHWERSQLGQFLLHIYTLSSQDPMIGCKL